VESNTKTKKVNLFLIGAPKCGTTSLANYLHEHPQIKLGSKKEPHYFNFDMKNRYADSISAYSDIYKDLNSKYILDASVWYYYSEKAMREIIKYNPEAKFIYMVREPVSLFYSLHQELLNTYEETKKSPQEAWHISFERMGGKKIPTFTKEKTLLYYPETCALGKRLEHILQYVDLKNLIVIDFKQFAQHTSYVYDEILSKLELEKVAVDFINHNPRKYPKNMALTKLIKVAGALKRNLGITHGFQILNYLKERNTTSARNIVTDPKLDQEVKNYFQNDVKKLSLLSNQDFANNWGY
jgi:hypothetical protein